MSKARHLSCKFILLLVMLTAVSFSAAGYLYAKFTTKDDSHSFSLDIDAKYSLTFNGNGGDLSVSGNEWTIESGAARKSIEVGERFGTMPQANAENCKFLGWSPTYASKKEGIFQVSYICNASGKEFINTGIIPRKSYEYGITFSIAQDSRSDYSFGIMGARDAYPNGVNIGSCSNDYYGVRQYCPLKAGEVYTLVIKNNVLTVSGSNINKSFTYEAKGAEVDYSIYIFALNTGNSAGLPTDKGMYASKIYSAYIKDSEGNYLMNMIPVQVTGINEYGFYDSAREKIFLNEGTGNFTGPEVQSTKYIEADDIFSQSEDLVLYADYQKYSTISFDLGNGEMLDEKKEILLGSVYGDLPEPSKEGYTFKGWSTVSNNIYAQLEYLENTPGTDGHGLEYIDTGLVPKKEYSYDLTVSVANKSTDGTSFGIMGARNIAGAGHGLNIGSYNNDFYGQRKPVILESREIYNMNMNNARLTVTGGGTVQTQTYTVTEDDLTSNNIYIFAFNSLNSPAYPKESGTRIYSVVIKDSYGKILMELAPALRKADNEPGLYDYASGTFFINISGNGRFVYDVPEKDAYLGLTDSNSIMNKEKDHTLYAIWEADTL